METKKKCKSLIIESTKYLTHYTKKFEQRKKWEKPDDKKIHAVIPGTILKIFVKEGQKMKAGEKLILLEAMKMENKILIPNDGKIKEIKVKEGQRVMKKDLLLELV
ncbi:MAG: acetyl-CoA carboxylase biotin carboxyl carrier protein subunit [Bacteroidales bacterium]|nr:acetyl-CoA carboxylase biotin carboxyl carrier protein subunit [Bacteroidales bacterium]